MMSWPFPITPFTAANNKNITKPANKTKTDSHHLCENSHKWV